MEDKEVRLLETIESSLRAPSLRRRFDETIERLAQTLTERPEDVMAWETVPLDSFTPPLPAEIRSAWIFTLRSGVATGAERHSNSHQRSLAYCGVGSVRTRTGSDWHSVSLASDPEAPIEARWASIPAGVWHEWIVGEEELTVLSFHTVPADELVEERPGEGDETGVQEMRYAERGHDTELGHERN